MGNEQRGKDFAKASAQFDGIYAQVAFSTGCEHGYQYALQHPAWIPVEERLPEKDKESNNFSVTVLVYTEDGCKDTAYYDYKSKKWRWLSRVTHWMPLPTPPQRKEE